MLRGAVGWKRNRHARRQMALENGRHQHLPDLRLQTQLRPC